MAPMTTLRQRLASRELLAAPGIFDMVSLRLANTFGFDALYMTGYGTVASYPRTVCSTLSSPP